MRPVRWQERTLGRRATVLLALTALAGTGVIAIAPTASAAGVGNQTITPTFGLAVPASTLAGIYTSTWTFTLSSGP